MDQISCLGPYKLQKNKKINANKMILTEKIFFFKVHDAMVNKPVLKITTAGLNVVFTLCSTQVALLRSRSV